MMHKLLNDLTSIDFYVSLGSVSSAHALRRCLRRTNQVEQLELALRRNVVTEENIRAFVAELMRHFKRGKQFPHEIALAVVAVCLEARYTDFADEFLLELAKLDAYAEFALSPKVAKICRTAWGAVISPTDRTEQVILAERCG